MEDRKNMQTRPVQGAGRLSYPSYRGKEPYVFVSYARLDSERVLAEIKRFNEAGLHVWYDEGIAPGGEWSDAIAEALSDCSVFVVFLTPTSAPRENVLNEIDFALNEQKPFLAIYLDETTLTPGLKLRISRKQAIFKYLMTEEEYENKITEAFTRFGLKQGGDVSIKSLDEKVKHFLGSNKPASQKDTVKPPEEFCDDSPEDAGKNGGSGA